MTESRLNLVIFLLLALTTCPTCSDLIGDTEKSLGQNSTMPSEDNSDFVDSSDDDYEYEYEYDIDESLNTYNWRELGPSLIVYVVTFICGVVGNGLILVSVIRQTHVKSSPVNVFLASLATADLLLILICLPLKVRRGFLEYVK